MMETMAAPIWPLEGAPKLILLFQGYLGPMLVKAQGKLKNKGLLESRHKAQSTKPTQAPDRGEVNIFF